MKKMMLSRLLLLATAFTVMVSSCKPKDADILAAVNAKLKSKPGLENVSADVKEAVVTLAGECKDDSTKTMAETETKEVKGVKSVINNCTVTAPVVQAPVVIEVDSTLMKGAADAVKDYKGVTATVNDGVVTLSGEIKRSELPKLMMSVSSLKPKSIKNELVIK